MGAKAVAYFRQSFAVVAVVTSAGHGVIPSISKYEPCVFGDLSIKGDTIGEKDFLYQQIADAIKCNDSGEFADILFHAAKSGESFSLDFDCQGRDGSFNQNQLFAVFEEADVLALIDRLQRCLEPFNTETTSLKPEDTLNKEVGKDK